MTRRSLEEIRQTGGSDAATSLLIVLVEPCEICDPERASKDPSRRPPASRSVRVERASSPSLGRLDAVPEARVGRENTSQGFALLRHDTVSTALTSREIEVLRLIAEGLSSRAIAARLRISTRTADAHRLHIKRKLGVNTIGELVRAGIRGGYVAP
jgi:DNA-binding CsgD family transcriptional regulator